MTNDGTRKLEGFRAPTNVKIALLWTSLMFLYIYNDYFSMYTHGTIEDMAEARPHWMTAQLISQAASVIQSTKAQSRGRDGPRPGQYPCCCEHRIQQ